MSFQNDIKYALGHPLIDVELEDKPGTAEDSYSHIEERTLRSIADYHPQEYIVRKDVPSAGSGVGEGYLDVSSDGFLGITDVYPIVPKASNEVLLPWSFVHVWEQSWLGQKDFAGTDFLVWQNSIAQIRQVTNTVYAWRYYKPEEKVYVTNIPSYATGVGVRGLKRITKIGDLDTASTLYEYALKLAVGFAKQSIGLVLRKYNVDGMEMPGSDYINEGKEEVSEALEWIHKEAVYPGGLNT